MNKKTTFLINFLIFLFFLSFSFSCKPRVIRRARRVKDTSFARVVVRGKIVVGVYKLYPPYVTYATNHRITGFDIDVAHEVARVMNVDIEFRPLSWNDLVNGLEKNHIDCLWGAMPTSNFENIDCIFSDPYMNSSLTVMVSSDSIYSSINELKSTNVGFLNLSDTVSATNTLSIVMQNFENLQVYNDFEMALDAVRRKKIDALVLDIFSISHLINTGETIHMFNEPINKLSYAVVFNQNSVSLRDRVNDALLKLEYDGKLAEISRKWFGTDIVIIGK